MNEVLIRMLCRLSAFILIPSTVVGAYHANPIWTSQSSFDEPGGIVVADVDLDEKLEMIVNEKRRIVILEQSDLGNTSDFIEVWKSPLLGSRVAKGIAVADADCDGHLEIIVSNNSPGDFYIFENIGDNLWMKVFQQHVKYDIDSLITADADFDGQQEIIVGANHSIHIYENTGDDAYSKVWTHDLPFFNVNGVAVYDLDNDCKNDIVVSDNFQLFVFENSGNDEYELVWQSKKLSYLADVIIADSDGDEKMDIIVGGDPIVYLFKNTGDNKYQQAWSTKCKGLLPMVTDINHNGRAELVFTRHATHVFENCGVDSYKKIWEEKQLLARTVADIDYDGNYELVGVNAEDSRICFWEVSKTNTP